MKRMRRLCSRLPFVCIASLVLAVVGCSAQPTRVSLEFLADFNAPSGIAFAQLAESRSQADPPVPAEAATTRAESLQRKLDGDFGGISAIAYDASSGLLYGLSDSTNLRIFVMTLELSAQSLRVAPETVLPLVDAAGAPIPVWTLDPEGLAIAPDGQMLVASEGYVNRDPRVDPGIFRFDRGGRLLGNLPVPPYYLPRGETGVRHNVAFEGLSLSPDGAFLLAALERDLTQDDDCRADAGCLVRILRYRRETDGWQVAAEYFYRTDSSIVSSLGLAELLWIGDRAVLTLERGFERLDDGSTLQKIRIYQVALPDRLSQSEREEPLAKRLVLDLDTVKDRFSEGFRRLDNYEGLSFGPQLPNGDRTLLVISDDNYSNQQRTSLLAFRIVER